MRPGGRRDRRARPDALEILGEANIAVDELDPVGDVLDQPQRPGGGQIVEDDDLWPPSTSARTRFEPMNPAPPVTMTRMRAAALFESWTYESPC